MKNTDYFRDKKITVVGLARSGLSCANLLHDLGSEVWVTDSQDSPTTRLSRTKLKSPQIRVELGVHSLHFIQGRDMIVVSPGVPSGAAPVLWAREYGVQVISEIEVGWLLCPAKIIAVTGSNGKTTVTTLIGNVLESVGKRVFICGNIGKSFCANLDKIEEGDFVCLEVSSFQLENIRDFKPYIAVILNFSRNHLDRYTDLKEYLGAKKRIFMNQDWRDYAVLNYADPVLRGLDAEIRSKVVYFSENPSLNPNQLAVEAVGSILNIDKEKVYAVFREFRGIEHRLEYVTEINNVEFINDSKATTAEAVIWALESMPSPIILIAGGRDKGVDYGAIKEAAFGRVKGAVLIGEARPKLETAFQGLFPVHAASTLKEAVGIAFQKALPGDCVLLSPMCSSFDMFSDYEDRGRVFKEAVYSLQKGWR